MQNAFSLHEVGNNEIITVYIDIIGEHIQGADRGILGDGESVVHRHRGVVHRAYRHAYCQGIRTAVVVVSGNCEGEVSVPLTGRAGEGVAIG